MVLMVAHCWDCEIMNTAIGFADNNADKNIGISEEKYDSG